MNDKLRLGYAFCGSFCTVKKSVEVLKELSEIYDIQPIFSENFQNTDTRFGRAEELCSGIEEICQKRAIRSFTEAEPIGPCAILDAMIIAPCTGNTLAKLACGVTDGAVTMSAKAHLRNLRPLIIAPATNDALSVNFKNIATLIVSKNIYFVPMRQDDPIEKPNSLIANFASIAATIASALDGKQIQPVFIG